MKRTLLLFTYLFIGLMPTAQAYIDPGSGSLLWQLLVAAFVGLLFHIKKFKIWLFAHFQKKNKD